MQRSAAAVGSAVFFVVAPGTVAGVVPWLITGWDIAGSAAVWRVAQAVGVLLIVAGASFVRWYEEPALVRRYGNQYREYRRNVRAWLPRRRPWPLAEPTSS